MERLRSLVLVRSGASSCTGGMSDVAPGPRRWLDPGRQPAESEVGPGQGPSAAAAEPAAGSARGPTKGSITPTSAVPSEQPARESDGSRSRSGRGSNGKGVGSASGPSGRRCTEPVRTGVYEVKREDGSVVLAVVENGEERFLDVEEARAFQS